MSSEKNSLLPSLLYLLASLSNALEVDFLLLLPFLVLFETDRVNLVCHSVALITKSDTYVKRKL